MSRKRIKGNTTESDWILSLNIVFEILLKLLILLDPYMPFTSEYIYQQLKLGIEKETGLVQ